MKKEIKPLAEKIANESAGGTIQFNEGYILVKNINKSIQNLKEELDNEILDLGILEKYKNLNGSEVVEISLDIINKAFEKHIGDLK